MAPAFFEKYAQDRLPWVRPEDHAHILDGWRKAGWQETKTGELTALTDHS
jgi:hypothetical protein